MRTVFNINFYKEEMKRSIAVSIKKHGWAHKATNPNLTDGVHPNFRTYGIEESYNHLDFQIVLPIHPKDAHVTFINLVEMVKSGTTFHEDIEYINIIEGYPVKFKRFKDGNDTVLRLLVPDKKGRFPEHSSIAIIRSQLDEFETTEGY